MKSKEKSFLEVEGARVHNLKNVSLKIPRYELVVITGLSGSGKSSLTFDTIFAEGQRRYLETFSGYARQFMGELKRPDVDKISGLSPVISIEQKTTSRNPRSTVGTITEVYDFLRLLFAKTATAYSSETGEAMVRYSQKQIVQELEKLYTDKNIILLAPLIKGRKGQYQELFAGLLKKGYTKVRIDEVFYDLDEPIEIDRYKIHDIELVIDSLKIETKNKKRLDNSLEIALKEGKGIVLVQEGKNWRFFSQHLMCPTTGIAYEEPDPNSFSFNSPYGACPTCSGLGEVSEIPRQDLLPKPQSTLEKGAIPLLKQVRSTTVVTAKIEGLLKKNGYTAKTPFKEIDDSIIQKIFYGTQESFSYHYGGEKKYSDQFEGLIQLLQQVAEQSEEGEEKKPWIASLMRKTTCPTCYGTRLKAQALFFKIGEENIADLSKMSLDKLYNWVQNANDVLGTSEKLIATEIIKELKSRLNFLLEVGLSYLHLNRSSHTLSGGEAQRIRLATQIGSELTQVLYILDEPSIGLHPSDNERLIQSLQRLRDLGNSVLVVEHDKDMMLHADHIVEIGPFAGKNGGEVLACSSKEDFVKNSKTITAQYLRGEKNIALPKNRRAQTEKNLRLIGATGNNLKNISVNFPLGNFIVVSGVSGGGKSSLITGTLYPALHEHFYKEKTKPLPYQKIEGLEHLDKVIAVDQKPIGRTPRSNPATYVGFFADIRNLFALMPEAKIRGYAPGTFSFNVKNGGRCETCRGSGYKTIQMGLLPDVYVLCDDCQGKRYLRETLEVRYKGKSISEVLAMSIDEADVFFEAIPQIHRKIKALQAVGLGYITLGQSSTTLSGGEAQRVKLATELGKKQTGKTFYLLDEPTTGLHFDDVKMLLSVLQKLVDLGNTVLVVEHNLDVIKVADYVIDMGPVGGDAGGYVVAEGTPETVAKNKKSLTAPFLMEELKSERQKS